MDIESTKRRIQELSNDWILYVVQELNLYNEKDNSLGELISEFSDYFSQNSIYKGKTVL